jgi:hypothetical protein
MNCMDMDAPDPTLTSPDITYLREITLEGRELYNELRDSGFTDKQATIIVGHFVVDAVNSRDEETVVSIYEYSDDDDYDDDEDELDDDGDSSI